MVKDESSPTTVINRSLSIALSVKLTPRNKLYHCLINRIADIEFKADNSFRYIFVM